MSDHRFPRLFANAHGIWCEHRPGACSGIKWSEIFRVSGGKLDCVTHVETALEIDFEFGEFMELYGSWDGFGEVVEAIAAKLPGISPDWLRYVQELEPQSPWLVVWRRV